MKYSEMKIARRWRKYVGQKDERLEVENNKVYKVGFILLSFGMLVLLLYQMMALQVAWVHSESNSMPSLFKNPIEALLYAWLVIVSLVCVFMQTRKGYVDTNRFAQTEKFPVGYFSLIAGFTGVLSALAIALMRCIAEVQIVPLESVYWGANVACGVFFGVFIFAATLLAFYLSFTSAKRNRKRIEAQFEE